MYKKSLFIFRRSLRLHDNIGLSAALKESKKVIPIFIFTPEQLIKNPYKSNNAVQFMIESLSDLDLALRDKGSKLFYFFGKPDEVIKGLIENDGIDAVFVNRDYTPYAIVRDEKIATVCKKNEVAFCSYEDILLNHVGSTLTASDKPYQKYTPYFNKARKLKVTKPMHNTHKNYISQRYKLIHEYKGDPAEFYKKNQKASVRGGRKNALKILKQINNFKNYDKKRNFLTYQTTLLSAYIKFGCVSIREVFYAIRAIRSRDLLRQLYWRDFYYNIAFFFPHVFKGPMKEKYAKISWKNNRSWFETWKKGITGFPIVDACMREINTTGYMHNRGRLIVSNFLIKILLIDWKKGEKYFAIKLIDYDPSVNNGNWQWSASCGADSQPYFRIFNPWAQSKRFDPDCTYIKKWIPQLQEVKPADIHNWYKKYNLYRSISYPRPIVDYNQQRKKALNLYSYIFK